VANSRGSRFLSRSRLGSGSRRQTAWDIGPVGALSITGNSINLIALGAQAATSGLTIVRFRGELLLGLTVSGVLLDGFRQVAAGVCIVSENAFDAGVTAVPDPIADIGWEGWLWYWTGAVFAANTTPSGNLGMEGARVVIDSKAMRKIKNTDVLIAVVATASLDGTTNLEVRFNSRTLLKLP